MQGREQQRRPLPVLLKAIDSCRTIGQLCELVRHEHIVIQMKSQQAASNIPYRELPKNPAISPVESLRAQIREAAIAMYRGSGEPYLPPAGSPNAQSELTPSGHTKEQLIRAVETCPTIDKLFELVKNEHIVIQMKSQNSASCLPQRRLTGAELMPDSTPLDRLKQQVLEAIIYGR